MRNVTACGDRGAKGTIRELVFDRIPPEMGTVFIAVTFGVGVGAFATFAGIVRDVWPHLSAEHRDALKQHSNTTTFRQWRVTDRAIAQAWQTHVEVFPHSRKRLLFGVFLVCMFLSVMAYPLGALFVR